jgi:hypothetical protein
MHGSDFWLAIIAVITLRKRNVNVIAASHRQQLKPNQTPHAPMPRCTPSQ